MAEAPLVCEWTECDRPLPPYSGKGRPAKYHPECARNKKQRAYRAKNRKTVTLKPSNQPVTSMAESKDGRGSMRGGDQYLQWVEDGGPGRLDRGSTHEAEALAYGVSRVTITHWFAQYREDLALAAKRAQWKPHATAEHARKDFAAFRDRYFTVARGPMKGQPPATTEFHLRWINAILGGMAGGEQLMILSPPRHGKSLLMAHFVIWCIVRDPDIAIIWVAGNENIARRFGSLVRDELESNSKLKADYCGPGGSFKPSSRSGAQWRDDEFEVATRTRPQPAPTFKAVGRGGRMLSMDADLIVTDDIEDNKTTMQPAQREATDLWFHTDLASRKEEHTGWVYIGSRQHPEDLASKLLESGEWRTIVESAHDDNCVLPEADIERHVECVLWPEVRSFKYLMQKRRTVGPAIFEMQYLNRPRSDGMTVFPREVVEDCRDYSRRLGDIPPGSRLIAGLDPSGSSGYQSAVLWAVHVESNTRSLVDLENVQGGGVVHLRSILERWSLTYPGLTEWVIEENIVADTLATDVPLRELKQRLGFRFVPHKTGRNKWDLRMGVPGMKPHFEDKRINLPYGDEDTRAKVEVLINQFVNFTDNVSTHQTSYKTDLVMAAWFPEATIQGWQRAQMGGVAVMQSPMGLGGLDSFGSMFGGS